MEKIQYSKEQIQKIIDFIDLIEIRGIKNLGLLNNIIAILDRGERVVNENTRKDDEISKEE